MFRCARTQPPRVMTMPRPQWWRCSSSSELSRLSLVALNAGWLRGSGSLRGSAGEIASHLPSGVIAVTGQRIGRHFAVGIFEQISLARHRHLTVAHAVAAQRQLAAETGFGAGACADASGMSGCSQQVETGWTDAGAVADGAAVADDVLILRRSRHAIGEAACARGIRMRAGRTDALVGRISNAPIRAGTCDHGRRRGRRRDRGRPVGGCR